MKKILTILILLQFVYAASNAQIKLIGNITTNGKASYPTHIDSLGKGGMMVMPTIGSRDSIPSLRRKFGMLVYVQENDSLYKLKNTASSKKVTDNSDWLSIGLSSTADVDKFLKYAKTSDSLYIIGNTIIDSNLTVKKDLEVKGNLILNTGLQFNDSLVVSKGARIQQGMKLIGKLDLRDTLSVKGISILDDSLYVKGVSVLSKIKADSGLLNKSLVDSANALNNRINNKLNIDDTTNMLSPYLRTSDTTSMMSNSLRISDTASMLSNTMKVSDTAAMLEKYARKFTKNVKLSLTSGRTLGRYNVGDTVYAAGKTLDEFLYDISTVLIPPSYAAPSTSVGISGTSSFEIGTRMDLLPDISLTHTYTQNDAGAESSPSTAIYYKGGVSLGAGVTTDAAAGTVSGSTRILTSTINYTVQNVTYAAGGIKNDNLGNPYPTGKINAGTINGGNTASITTFQYSYYGPSSTPVVSDYFKTQLKSAAKSQTLSFSGLVNQYLFYAFPTALGTLTSIKIGGFESIDAFNRTSVNLINAQGYSMPYYVYVSQNYFNGNVTGIIFQ